MIDAPPRTKNDSIELVVGSAVDDKVFARWLLCDTGTGRALHVRFEVCDVYGPILSVGVSLRYTMSAQPGSRTRTQSYGVKTDTK